MGLIILRFQNLGQDLRDQDFRVSGLTTCRVLSLGEGSQNLEIQGLAGFQNSSGSVCIGVWGGLNLDTLGISDMGGLRI